MWYSYVHLVQLCYYFMHFVNIVNALWVHIAAHFP